MPEPEPAWVQELRALTDSTGVAAPETWMPSGEWDDLPTVCITHLRFVPCRGTQWREHACQLSTHPDAVTAVRSYQSGGCDV